MPPTKLIAPIIYAKVANRERCGRAFDIGWRDYDLGDELGRRMLDRRITYSCGYRHGVELDKLGP